MSHSTTTTTTFLLNKYSYAHTAEWQHFTNPVIRLVLDVTKSSTGELESVRLRIKWSMNSDEQQNEMILENLDLLAFSAIPMGKTQKQGLPLKAVYRDAVVGIRYLHPLDFAANPTYRRFQMTFTTSASAAQFIDAICNVCPCRANPGETQATQRPMPNFAVPSTQIRAASVAPFDTPARTLPVQETPRRPTSALVSSPLVASIDQPLVESVVRQDKPDASQRTISSSLPSSSMPTSSSANNPNVASEDVEPMLNALQEATGLYSLSTAALEKLVGEIVREDGFERLMENLSTMWRIKTVLGQ